MATLQSNANGNFSSATIWSLVDATSFLNSETNTTASTVSFVGSSSFITGAITIDGISVKLSARATVPSGTFSVRLFNVTGAAVVAGTTVTINVSDIPRTSLSATHSPAWVFMKFSAPVLLSAATSYRVEIQTSVAGQVTLFRDATANNWSRMLRTTTVQALAASDVIEITGEFVSAGVNSTHTITMDNTSAATVYGLLEISVKGILTWGTTAATNYYLKIAGNLVVWAEAQYICGTIGTPMPSDSTAKLEFACTANVQFGLEIKNGAVFTTYGNVVTVSAMLNANAAIGATSLTTDISTGWKTGDVIALSSTTRTATQAESKALTADAVGNTLTITALTNAHDGVAPIQAELINLTRNIQIFGTSTTFQSYVNIQDATTIDIQYTEFFQLGSATANKRGVDVATILNSGSIKNCSFHDFIVTSSVGLNLNSTTLNNITVDNCVFYNTQSTALNLAATTNSNWTITNIIAIRCVGGQPLITLASLNGTISNITATSGANIGIQFSNSNAPFATKSTFTTHSNAANGIALTNITSLSEITFSNITTWRNNTNGISWSNCFNVLVDTAIIFGNTTAGVNMTSHHANNRMINLTVNGGVTLVQPIGVALAVDQTKFIIENSTFGSTTTHTTADVSCSAANAFIDTVFRNCLFSSATQFANTSLNMVNNSEIGVQKFQQIAGNHRTYNRFGIISIDSVIYNVESPSVRMTPNILTQKLKSKPKHVATPNGQTATIRVFVRKSVIGDGAAYNGNQPRLMLLEDAAMGILADTVLATATNAADGAFMELVGVTPAITDNGVFRVYVDCDGTSGWVNVDSWSVS